MEVQAHGLERAGRRSTEGTVRIAAAPSALPLVGTNDSHYPEADDSRAHEALLCIQTGTTIDDPNRLALSSRGVLREVGRRDAGASSRSCPRRSATRWRSPSAATSSSHFGQFHLPALPGARRLHRSTRYLEHLRAARGSRAATARSPGRRDRGSGCATSSASSRRWASPATSWWSGTSSPTRASRGSRSARAAARRPARSSPTASASPTSTRSSYGLIFERFLNPERISMPDMDIDFADDRRDEVIQLRASTATAPTASPRSSPSGRMRRQGGHPRRRPRARLAPTARSTASPSWCPDSRSTSRSTRRSRRSPPLAEPVEARPRVRRAVGGGPRARGRARATPRCTPPASSSPTSR